MHAIPTRYAQSYRYTVSVQPEISGGLTPTSLFGACINGVTLDPGAAEFFHGDRTNGWQYEALSGAIALELDESHAHVQPTSAYHYHAVPSLLLNEVVLQPDKHSRLIGWTGKGFPIYALYGWDEGGSVLQMRSSYRIKSEYRPTGGNQPGGTYDGMFVNDYEYVAGTDDLDPCNDSQVITPDFPEGTYAYFMTEEWPFISRCFAGTPSADFGRRRPPPTPVWRAVGNRSKGDRIGGRKRKAVLVVSVPYGRGGKANLEAINQLLRTDNCVGTGVDAFRHFDLVHVDQGLIATFRENVNEHSQR